MKRNTITIIFLSIVHFTFLVECAQSQNVVSNSDFEQYFSLPKGQGEITKATGWDHVVQSADYMNTGYTGWSPHVGGAYAGNGYAGFASYGNPTGSAEALGQNISGNPILPNTSYSVGLYAKKSTSSAYSQICGGITLYGFSTPPTTGGVNKHASELPGAILLWTSNTVSDSLWHYYNRCFQSNVTINYIVLTMEKVPNCREYVYIDNVVIIASDNILNLGKDTTLCEGNILTLNAANPNATYLWQDNSKKQAFTVTKPGKYWVTVTGLCKIIADTINVSYNPSPKVNLGNDTNLCERDTLALDATVSNATYKWQDNSTNPSLTAKQKGSYWVKVTLNNCSAADTINLNYTPLPIINLGNDTILCQEKTLLLNATTLNATYKWQDNSTNPDYIVAKQGTYWIEIKVNNCKASDTINVDYHPWQRIKLGNDTSLCNGTTLILNAKTANSTYLWQDNSTNPTFNIIKPGNYWVEVTNYCKINSDTFFVEFVNCDCNLYIPNSFSPNKDLLNDGFSPISDCEFSGYQLIIFNLWGEKIFETVHPSESWDGTFRGETSQIGVYPYLISYKFNKEEPKLKYGNIHLIK